MYTLGLESAGDSKRAGMKALNLFRMIRAGLPVPGGFVLTSDAYARFVSLDKLWDRTKAVLEGLDHEDTGELRRRSSEIRSMILNSEIPDGMKREIKEAYDGLAVSSEVRDAGGKALDFIRAGRGESFVAVRSSPVGDEVSHSFAGQTLSLVNIIGSGNLYNSVKLCWASLFSPGAIYYRRSRGVSGFPMMAVVIQRMLDPEKSGVVFTADPSRNNTDRIVIEGSWGLGESVVSGTVNPDRYVLEKGTGEILETIRGKKLWQYTRDALTGKTIKERVTSSRVDAPLLSGMELNKLWELSKRAEEAAGRPQDIEWAIARNKAYVLQARPITTLNREIPNAREVPESQSPLLKGISASPGLARGSVRIIADSNELERVEHGDVLVAKNASTGYIPLLRRVSGLVLDTGGMNSYMATISREFGLPCITGTENATTILREGQEIILDSAAGGIYQPVPRPQQLLPQPDGAQSGLAPVPGIKVSEGLPALGEGITATEVKLNLAVPELDPEKAGPCDGVGILRSERMLTAGGRNPFEAAKANPEELIRLISERVGKLAKLLYPRPLCYRSLDLSTDETRDMEGETPGEPNPLMGWRGIRRALDQPGVFRCETEALKRLNREGLSNIVLLLPFISTVREFRAAKSLIASPLKLGIVIDTPSSALGIGDFCREGISHAAINLANLAQLTLGVDRENPEISKLYSETDPSVLMLIGHVVRECKKHGVEVSVFGDTNPSPELIEGLISLGIKSISVDQGELENMKTSVSRIERKLLLEKIRNPQN